MSLRDARNENETVVNLFSTAVSSALDWFVTEMPTRQTFYSGPTRPETDSILRTAGSRLMSSIRDSVSPTLISRDLFVALDNLSIRRHESAAGSGKVAFVRADSIADLRPLQFRAAVPLDETDWARKLLELAHGSMVLLSTGEEAVGIADLAAIGSSPPTVTFEGQHQWSLRAGARALMHVSSGVPCLPSEPLSKDAFARTFVRVFPRHTGSLDNVWATIEAVLSQHHGAIVMIAEDAASEAQRLSTQGTQIDAKPLSSGEAISAARIDGAILLDPIGTCHAVGVVLDGKASDAGTPSRGARFNSALRYVLQDPTRVAVVRSEDGDVDLLPRLRTQVRRLDLTTALAAIRESRDVPPTPDLRRAAALIGEYADSVDLTRDDVLVLIRLLDDGLSWGESQRSVPTKDRHPTDFLPEPEAE